MTYLAKEKGNNAALDDFLFESISNALAYSSPKKNRRGIAKSIQIWKNYSKSAKPITLFSIRL